MAEVDAPPDKKKRYLSTKPKVEIKETILKCLKCFERSGFLLVPLKIMYCNGANPGSFTDAYCEIRQSEVLFTADSIFQPGIKFLRKALNENTSYMTHEKQIAVDRLVHFFNNIEGVSRQLSQESPEHAKKRETYWAVQLVHHILEPLAVDQYYILDDYSKYQSLRCWCCTEDIRGEYEDTSIGNEKVWHGCADILMGQRSVDLKLIDDETEETESVLMSSFEIEDESNLTKHASELIAETIVFAFLQKKIHSSSLQNFLIPTIGISKKEIVLYFYDPKHDILLQSHNRISIWSDSENLSPHTIVALWLAINYNVTCSGITDKMLDLGYKANFLSHFDDKIKNTYEKELKFGGCRNMQQDANMPKWREIVTGGKPIEGEYDDLSKEEQ